MPKQKPKHRRSTGKTVKRKKGVHLDGADLFLGTGTIVCVALLLITAANLSMESRVLEVESIQQATVSHQVEIRGQQAELVKAVKEVKKAVKKAKKPTVHELAYAEGKRAGVPPALVDGVVRTESGGNPHAVSDKGACGLMQLMPGTASDMGVKDCHNPRENVRGGADYLSKLDERYGNHTIALIAYNYGPGNTDKWLKRGGHWSQLPRETRDYVSKVRVNEALSEREMQMAEAR